ncbi:metalloregulator ArsR/SmtB family transcription factor [Thermophilibacter provencensis]|uniref:Metalloregulator ArsR/SmtB family transcription factor n=1 Tax=Thermophilibacter provencensis TaxID=1852386 RepID=A0ABT7V0T6_9ACTN|nr:metalloregulator ArsR/SmtB family transcription factor [Thermophilibacter provencensis]MDM8270229.1 metalloregulator ArsR/SmtB family transcription factor [Thermophilibacter provencensis]
MGVTLGEAGNRRPRVAFVCTHNSCRSQIAEALSRVLASDAFEAFSAGTHPADAVNPDALRLLRNVPGVDTARLRPKALDKLPPVDVVVTMGCGVQCPMLPCAHREDWGLEDPTGRGDEAFLATMDEIERRVRDLAERLAHCEVATTDKSDGLSADLLKALADERRLDVLRALSQADELCACKLLERLDISQPTLSHHMALLVSAGLVSAERRGRWTHYRLERGRMARLAAALEELANAKPSNPDAAVPASARKTLYLVGGPMGVGKSTVCRELSRMLPRSVLLDGDWCWQADPFQVTPETKAVVLDNICHALGNFLRCDAYENVVFGWVMHERAIVEGILARLPIAECGAAVRWVSLVASEEELRRRIEGDVSAGLRKANAVERALAYLPLYRELGSELVDTTGRSPREVAELVAGGARKGR